MTTSTVGATRPYRALDRCPVCGSPPGASVFTATRVPVLCNELYATAAEAAAAPTGSIDLVVCSICGLLWNAAFDESAIAYSPAYENSLHFSPWFRHFATELAADLVRRHGLTGATVVEIGSGKGDFLGLLCDAGAARGVGYDPSYDGHAPERPGLSFVPALFPEHEIPDADFLCARHVFEHLCAPARVLRSVRAAVPAGRRLSLYLEVPDGAYLLRETALWDVIYEHPLHFTAPAMTRLFADAGFSVSRVDTSFGGQYLSVEGSTDEARPEQLHHAAKEPAALAEDFSSRAEAVRARWSDRLGHLAREGATVVLWGAGSKGVSFLATVPAAASVAAVVDVNPRKHGRFLPVSARRVLGPEELRAVQPDAVILLNPIYDTEVRAMLAQVGSGAAVLTDPAP